MDWPLGEHVVQTRQGVLDVADDRQMGLAVFVEFGGVNIQMDDGALLAKIRETAGDAVVKAHAKGEQQIRAVLELDLGVGETIAQGVFAVDGPVGKGGAMHAQPAEGEWMRLGKPADAHEGGRHRNVQRLGEFFQFRRRATGDDAPPHIEHGPLGFFNQADDFVQRHLVGLQIRLVIPAQPLFDLVEGGPHRLGFLLLDVFGEINHHRAGPPALRQVKRLLDDARDVIDVGDQIGVFDDRQGDADDVGFLEAAAADHHLADLAGDGDEGAGIHVGVGDGGDEVGGAGAAGAHAHAGAAGGAGVAFRGEAAALFVAREDGADFGFGERLVDFHARSARIGEDDFAALAFEGFHEDVASVHDGADFRPRGGGFFRCCRRNFSCLAHGSLGLWPGLARGSNKKPTTWPAVGFC